MRQRPRRTFPGQVAHDLGQAISFVRCGETVLHLYLLAQGGKAGFRCDVQADRHCQRIHARGIAVHSRIAVQPRGDDDDVLRAQHTRQINRIGGKKYAVRRHILLCRESAQLAGTCAADGMR